MKNSLIYVLTLCVTIFLFSCSDKEAKPVDYAIISGKIENPISDKISITHTFLTDTITDTLIIDSIGVFNKKIQINSSKYFIIKTGEQHSEVFLSPGDSLYIKVDYNKFDETLNYIGIGAEQNNYLASLYLLKSKLPSMYDLIFVDLNSFIFKTDSILKVYNENLDKMIVQNSTFKTNEKNRIIAKIANMKSVYPIYYSYYNKTDLGQLPSDFYDIEKQLEINDTSILLFKDCEEFLKNKISALAEKKAKSLDSTLSKEIIDLKSKTLILDSLISNNTINHYFNFVTLKDHINYMGTDGIDEYLNNFKNKNPKTEYIALLENNYKKWEKISKGKPAPNFSVVDVDGKTFSLDNFKGKYIYIDVWATWCGPCKVEIPSFEKLKIDFKGKNIVFISISVDENKDSWKKMIKEKNMTPYQLYADGWKNSITKDYVINSIPRFILIDTEGKIINSNASRPSGNIADEIKKLEKLKK